MLAKKNSYILVVKLFKSKMMKLFQITLIAQISHKDQVAFSQAAREEPSTSKSMMNLSKRAQWQLAISKPQEIPMTKSPQWTWSNLTSIAVSKRATRTWWIWCLKSRSKYLLKSMSALWREVLQIRPQISLAHQSVTQGLISAPAQRRRQSSKSEKWICNHQARRRLQDLTISA